jgi:hypothetical protein
MESFAASTLSQADSLLSFRNRRRAVGLGNVRVA